MTIEGRLLRTTGVLVWFVLRGHFLLEISFGGMRYLSKSGHVASSPLSLDNDSPTVEPLVFSMAFVPASGGVQQIDKNGQYEGSYGTCLDVPLGVKITIRIEAVFEILIPVIAVTLSHHTYHL